MFTGLIREIATVDRFAADNLCLKASYRPKIGDSIAINGVCLSVVALNSSGFCVQLSLQTRQNIAVERYSSKVHIEPAMLFGDRVEGHLIQGHIDTIGTVLSIEKLDNSFEVKIAVDDKLLKLISPKGSIAIDGVSLTVTETFSSYFTLTIIPITMRETLFSIYKKGTRVNIETDMFARYIDNILSVEKHKKEEWERVQRFSALY